jgi:hypothetical protein
MALKRRRATGSGSMRSAPASMCRRVASRAPGGPAELLMVSVHQEEVPANYAILPLTYWVRYESVLGEPLQTSVQLSARQLRDLIPQEAEREVSCQRKAAPSPLDGKDLADAGGLPHLELDVSGRCYVVEVRDHKDLLELLLQSPEMLQ